MPGDSGVGSVFRRWITAPLFPREDLHGDPRTKTRCVDVYVMYSTGRFAEPHRAELDVVSLVAPTGRWCLLVSQVGEEFQAGEMRFLEGFRTLPTTVAALMSEHSGTLSQHKRSKLNGRARRPRWVSSAARGSVLSCPRARSLRLVEEFFIGWSSWTEVSEIWSVAAIRLVGCQSSSSRSWDVLSGRETDILTGERATKRAFSGSARRIGEFVRTHSRGAQRNVKTPLPRDTVNRGYD